MDSPAIEEVYQAVFTLYNDPNSQEKEKASLWLQKLQKSIHSWKVADELLLEKRNLESCYFAAQTMRSKIQHSFHELPEEAHPSLRDSLLTHISGVTETTNTAILTQFGLALADLALQMSSWNTPVEDLIKNFANNNIWALLEVLTVIPEEVMCQSIRLGANRREKITAYLISHSATINDFLKQTLNNNNQNTQVSVKVIKCMTSWMSLKACISDLSDNAVIGCAFAALGDHSTFSVLHEVASDCICVLLQCISYDLESSEMDLMVFNNVMALEQSYHLAVAHEDIEKAINYSRVFTELGESFLKKIISQAFNENRMHFAMKSLDLVLACVGHHDYEVAEISFKLWYRLSEELYQLEVDEISLMFKPYAELLIYALCRHCQMEPDHQGLLDKGDEFHDFRQKASDLTKDIVFLVGSLHCFKQMFISLQEHNASWEQTEAPLFIMQAIAKNILPEEYEAVPKVVEAVLSMPETAHIAVRYTSILLLGELSEWIEKHPECLQATLEYLLQALHNPSLASVAAHALHSISSTCRERMTAHLSGLIQIVRSLDSFKLSTEAGIALLRGVASVIARLPHDQVTTVMKEVCNVQVIPLSALSSHSVVINRNTASDPNVWLDRLAELFKYCRIDLANGQEHPCLPILVEVWPVISATMNMYSSDSRVVEKSCRCLRFIIRSLGKQSIALLEPLSKQMIAIYQVHRHSCFLYLTSILVDELAEDEACIPSLLSTLQSLITPTFELLQQPSGLVKNPDTVDDLFRLCGRFLKRVPVQFLQSSALEGTLQCGLLSCSLDHRDANTSVMKFFTEFVHLGLPNVDERCNYLVGQILLLHGESLMANLVHASVFSLHSYMLTDVADVIFELILWNRDFVSSWMQSALRKLPHTSVYATETQMLHFHDRVTRAEFSKQISRALKDFARLHH